jgi:hypothetical protein
MNEELKCPKCQQKDKVIARLKLELEQANHVLSSIFDMAERNNGVLYFRQNSGIWEIETGKDNE